MTVSTSANATSALTRTLITGGAGFIGSNLARTLLAAGEAVTVLDDLSTGHERNIAGIDVRFVRGSILDPVALSDAIAGCDFVVHLAAQVSVGASMEDPLGTHETNATGTLRVLEAARSAGVKRVVYAATCAIYGDDPTLPKTEQSPISAQSPYAVAKYIGEQYGRCYTNEMGLEVAAMRFFNVFGPRQDPAGGYAAVIPIFIARALRGQGVTIHGDGEQTRDFVFVDNVAQALSAARTATGAEGNVFNIGTGVQTSLNQLVAAIEAAVGTTLERESGPARAGDVRYSVADVSAARRVLGYDPAITLGEGISRTVDYYRQDLGDS